MHGREKNSQTLKRAHDAGLSVPEPFVWDRNILIMEFLGSEGNPYPQLKNVNLEDPAVMYEKIIDFIEDLYLKSRTYPCRFK